MLGFTSQKKRKLANLERKVYLLVDRKERKTMNIDDQGRDLVLTMHDYLGNFEESQRNMNYRSILSEAKRYLRENQHYL